MNRLVTFQQHAPSQNLAERSKFAIDIDFPTRKSVSTSLKASFCVSKLTVLKKKCIGTVSNIFCNVSTFKDSLQRFVEKKLVVLMA